MDFVAVVKRIRAGVDVVDLAVFGKKLFYVLELFGAAVDVRLSRILTASAVFCSGTGVLDRRRFFRSGALTSALHLSGSRAAVHDVLEKHGSGYGTYSSRHGGDGFGDLRRLVVIDVAAELSVLIDVHSDVYDDLAFP